MAGRKPYIKLDYDWRCDPKVMLFEEMHGKAALVDVVTTFIVMADCGGRICLADKGQMLRYKRELRARREEDVEQLVAKMAECGLVSKEAWEATRTVCSARSVRDAETVAKRRESAEAASAAASAKRRREAGGAAAQRP